MARHTTAGNMVTDQATGLTYFKDMAKVIPGFTGAVGADHGEWNVNLGAIALRDIAFVAPTQSFALGTQMVQGKPYANPQDYDQRGDNKWYKANQTYTPNAWRPGMDTGWNQKWSEVAWWEWVVTEFTTSGAGAFRFSLLDWNVYRCTSAYTFNPYKPGVSAGWQTMWNAVRNWDNSEGVTYNQHDIVQPTGYGVYICISGYTTGENPPAPYDDAAHWAEASTINNWEAGTSYSVGDVVWNAQEGGYYCCYASHHPLEPSEDSTHWEVVATPEEWSEDQDWSVDDLAATWGTPYVCISAHTGTYNRPETDADESHWSLIEPVPRVAGDGSMTALYYFCVEAHTASMQTYIGHPSYWRVFDKRWYEWWLSIVPDANGASFNPLDGGVMAGLDEIMDAIDSLNAGAGTDGHNDWRLPNEFEARVTRCFEDGKLWSDFSPPNRPSMAVWYSGARWVVMFAYWTGTPCKPGDGSNVYAVLVEGLYYSASGGNWVPETPQRKASQSIEYRPAVTDKYAMAPEGCPVVFIARPVRGGVVES